MQVPAATTRGSEVPLGQPSDPLDSSCSSAGSSDSFESMGTRKRW